MLMPDTPRGVVETDSGCLDLVRLDVGGEGDLPSRSDRAFTQ